MVGEIDMSSYGPRSNSLESIEIASREKGSNRSTKYSRNTNL